MKHKMLNIGLGNDLAADKVVAVISPNSAPMKRLRDEAKEEKKLIDTTMGRKTRSIIITESNHIFLSAIQPETISQRLEVLNEDSEKK
jgi:extracellular matrix regulatory protein A